MVKCQIKRSKEEPTIGRSSDILRSWSGSRSNTGDEDHCHGTAKITHTKTPDYYSFPYNIRHGTPYVWPLGSASQYICRAESSGISLNI
jgi:hypothetical protein